MPQKFPPYSMLHYAQPALKPGRVTQVILCPGQTQFKNYPGLDHVSRKIKKARYGSTMMAAAATFATPTF